MIQCPKCAASLPDWAQKCQFCGGDTKAVARPVAAPKAVNPAFQAPKWVWGAYYAVCVYYMIGGVGDIFEAIRSTQAKDILGETVGWNFWNGFQAGFGVFWIIFGIGLMLRVEVLRGIVNFVCGLRIIFGLFGLAGSFLGALFAGPLALILAAIQIINIATAAFMIYLIGETEKSAPNL